MGRPTRRGSNLGRRRVVGLADREDGAIDGGLSLVVRDLDALCLCGVDTPTSARNSGVALCVVECVLVGRLARVHRCDGGQLVADGVVVVGAGFGLLERARGRGDGHRDAATDQQSDDADGE